VKTIALEGLTEGLTTLTREYGAFLAQAGLYCLESAGHASGVQLEVQGSVQAVYGLVWGGSITPAVSLSWGDKDEATEYGATGVAIILAITITPHRTVERAVKGGGFDYWLGDVEEGEVLPFQRKGRLEISGIREGDKRDIDRRVQSKIKQTQRSTDVGFPAYIIVVEFSHPIAAVAIT